tara:strand:- start:9208 stop:11349 length:2142 start_codon:yes stop_codon:yes gene_type:complete
MTQDNLISTDIQSLEVSEAIVDLFELEYSPTTTLYFHSGVSTVPRILKVSADYNTITLNTPQTLSDDSSLVLTGLNKSTGVAASINALVNGATVDSQSVTIDNKTGATTAVTGWPAVPEVGMEVTGTDIRTDAYGEVVFNKNVYYGFPIGIDGIDISNDGAHSRPTLTIANVESLLRTSSTFQNAFDSQRAEAAGATGSGLPDFKLDNLVGKKVTRRRTLEKYLKVSSGRATDAASATDIIELPKSVFIIDRISSKTNIMVTMELASPFDLSGLRVPRREVVGKYCSWIYKGKKEFTTTALSGTVHVTSGTTTTLRGTGSASNWTTDFTEEISIGDEIIIDGKYIRTVTNIGTANDDVKKSQLTVGKALPIITTSGGSASSGTEPGPLPFAKVVRRKKGACSWELNGSYEQTATTSNKVYYTINDEPIIFFGITHTLSGTAWQKRTGSAYSRATGTVTVGTGADAGKITAISITAGGAGYSSTPPLVTFGGTRGTGAVATATVSGGAVTGVSITSAGTGYVADNATVTFDRPGAAIIPIASILNGSNNMSLVTGDILYTTDSGDEIFWLYTGATGTVTTMPSRNSSVWQLVHHYDGWTDRAYTINTTDALRNSYVLYPMTSDSNQGTIDFVETSTIWRNSTALSASSGERPASDSLFWTPGDVCGKLLMSCKKRYQFVADVQEAMGKDTVPNSERNTAALLPFGGFPGSRKFR